MPTSQKKDEFYTQLGDIEKEMNNYKDFFKDKVVFCNCDDPYESNFFKYFAITISEPIALLDPDSDSNFGFQRYFCTDPSQIG